MDDITTLLEQVSYPARREDLIAAAVQAGARPEEVERLEGLVLDEYPNADRVGRELSRSRAGSNPGLVAITPQPCEQCGFLIMPGEPHSCVEEKARFAESANKLTDEFETLDDAGGGEQTG